MFSCVFCWLFSSFVRLVELEEEKAVYYKKKLLNKIKKETGTKINKGSSIITCRSTKIVCIVLR